MEKLIALITLTRGIYEKWMMRRLVSGVVAIGGLLIITAMLIGAIVIAACYLAYITLLGSGFTPQAAGLMVCGMLLIAILLFAWLILLQVQRLRTLPRTMLHRELPGVSRANEVIDAFVNGFMGASAK